MAVYYVSPYTTTNGTGTWASPYSMASSTRPQLVDGDEVRVVSRYLTDLLTATTYTATYTTINTLTITAGGGLGADFAVNDVVYLPDAGTFFKVTSVSTNVIGMGFGASGIIPWYNTSSGQTNITVRKVNLAANPASSVGGSLTIWSGTEFANNVTVTDGWVDAYYQSTDGTAKTLIHSTASSYTLQLDNTTTTAVQRSGVVFNLSNTHAVCGNGTSSSVFLRMVSGGAALTFGQLCNRASNTSGHISTGNGVQYLTDVSITIIHNNTTNPLNSVYMYGGSFTILNQCADSMSSFLQGLSCKNVNVTIGNLVTNSGAGYIFNQTSSIVYKNTINFTGYIDIFSAGGISGLINALGNFTLTLSAGFVIWHTRRTVTVTTLGVGVLPAQSTNSFYDVVPLPSFNVNGNRTITTPYTLAYSIFNASANIEGHTFKKPRVITFDCPVAMPDANRIWGTSRSINYLVTFRDGTAPYEVCGPDSLRTTSSASTDFPVVTLDTVVVKTTGPSLKAYLATRQTYIWYNTFVKARKTIKIPVVSGASYTVTGWVRTAQTSYANGDCRVCIVNTVAEIVGQDMTTACINAWEQFTLTFTASKTEELTLVWEMYFAEGGKAFWLDDLTIT